MIHFVGSFFVAEAIRMVDGNKKIFLDPRGEAVAHLRASDRVMDALLASMDVGAISYEVEPSGFEALASSIASQFLSYRAADAIWQRARALTGITPEGFLGTSDEALRVAGLSFAKIAALKNLAGKTLSGELDFGALCRMSDEEAVGELVKLKGVGPWTAEMFLIFSLGRPDVFSWRDVGLVRAMEFLYGLPVRPDAKKVDEVSAPWRPHRTTAAIVLWETIHLKLVK